MRSGCIAANDNSPWSCEKLKKITKYSNQSVNFRIMTSGALELDPNRTDRTHSL